MTETQRAAMQQALDALEHGGPAHRLQAMHNLRAALAEPEPEPVAWMAEEWQQRVEQMRAETMAYKEAYFRLVEMVAKSKAMEPGCPVFLAAPPARRPLTDVEVEDIWDQYCDELGEASINDAIDIARAIERAHGIGGNDE